MGGKGIGGAAQQCLVHRGTVHTDADRQRLTTGMVQTGMDAGRTQGGCQQGRHGGLARRTGHAHELHLLRRSRQGRTQLVGGGKAVRQGLEVRICLFDGHWLLLFTMMKQ